MFAKAKLNKQDYIFRNKTGETLSKSPGQVNGLDFAINNLKDCEVYICDYIAQIFVDDCVNCNIHLGPVESSVFVRDCVDVTFSAAASQIRISNSTRITALVFSQSDPALEGCKEIKFGPYNFVYPNLSEHMKASKLHFESPEKNHWSQVYDFTPSVNPRNWEIIQPINFPGVCLREIEGLELSLNDSTAVPYHRIFGGTLEGEIIVGSQESKEEGLQSFSIQTSQAEAQNKTQNLESQNLVFVNQQPVQQTNDYEAIWDFDSQPVQVQPSNVNPLNSSSDPFSFGLNNQVYDTAPFGMGYETKNMFNEGGLQSNNNFSSMGLNSDNDLSNFYTNDELFKQNLANKNREDEFRQRIINKQREENQEKEKRCLEAKQMLLAWRSEKQKKIEGVKKINREQQSLLSQARQNSTPTESWRKIIDNIELKDGSYAGSRSIARMRDGILNKNADKK